MSGNYPIHPDLYELSEMMEPLLTMAPEALQQMTDQCHREWHDNASDENIIVTKRTIPGYDGVPLEIHIMEPRHRVTRPAPCLVYYHGGGFVFSMNGFQLRLVREYIRKTSCVAVCVDYRLAPEAAFPVPPEDCYSAFAWTYQNAAAIDIDPHRIAIGGDSAGGLFTAVVSLMARDRNGPKAAGQMLIYPTTDARLQSDSMKEFTDTPVWNAPITKLCWGMYLTNGNQGLTDYSSPIEAASLTALPPAYVEVAEFDCLKDDGIYYAQALKRFGVPTILYETRGTTHAFDFASEKIFLQSMLIKKSIERRIGFLRKIFHND